MMNIAMSFSFLLIVFAFIISQEVPKRSIASVVALENGYEVTINEDELDKMTDTYTRILNKRSENNLFLMYLANDCGSNIKLLSFNFNEGFVKDPKVMVRFDNTPAKIYRLLPKDDLYMKRMATVNLEDTHQIIKLMKKHNKMRIRLYLYEDFNSEAVFDLKGFTKSFNTMCEIKGEKHEI